MLDMFLKVCKVLWEFARFPLFIVACVMVAFAILCTVWVLIFHFKYKMEIAPTGQVRQRKRSILGQFLVDVPRRYVLDMYERETDFFTPRGIHIFCGEQGSGKTMACTHKIMELQKTFPLAKVITNYGYSAENDELNDWHQLLDYVNGHHGVIVGIDEIQNWFMSGTNKLPEGMLEVATQNRKNNRILCCTAQVFTRVNKGIREQVSMVYEPHTIFGCYTIVVMYKPVFDSEGNVIKRKYKGIYAFVHTDELRNAYDTYKVIHTLSKEGFKETPLVAQCVTNYNVVTK